MQQAVLPNYVAGEWCSAKTTEFLDVHNPATAETLSRVPLSTREEVDAAAQAASLAFEEWRRTPPTERIQHLFRLKGLLDDNFDEIARTITQECGKTLSESKGELRRGIENVEVAAGIPSLMMGYNLEHIAPGIDEFMIRQPVGVVAAITPFNFPAMIPLWFLPYAIACGNTFICKPSEKVPISMKVVFDLIDQLGLPPGVVNLINGSKHTVDAILQHPVIRAVSFVGSSAVAKYIYSQATAHGKRVQCGGGAKNPIIVLPDADMEMTTRSVADSAFGCAGQRCLATSVVMTVGEAANTFKEQIVEAATSRKVGYGLDPEVEMGPVITAQSKERVQGLIHKGVSEGAQLLVDGRNASIHGWERGNFVRPTILNNVDPCSEVAQTEIFGPVLSLTHLSTVDEAIQRVNSAAYGNMACLFTSSGAAARKFRYEAQVGNLGINVGVAAPMAFFPFSGFRESFFGDLHPQGRDAIEFYTEKKVVVERWPDSGLQPSRGSA
ncbi:CoA-acylating methylmalonate-semialdehyde dehydrogenase [Acidobacteria bacterium AH-259-A15]|nr:CoA-acylating methylmalonate-semialdehyde dehydrogenase [Acidobacteria bacterium AH-259-A15]